MEMDKEATTIMSELDRNLSLSLITTALTQINDSLAADPEEAVMHEGMARETLNALVTGLPYQNNMTLVALRNQTVNINETIDCYQYPNDCLILEVQPALDALNDGDPQLARRILAGTLHRIQ
jgi:hypothetical protein